MRSIFYRSSRAQFALRAAFIGGFCMFVSMLLGELIECPDLFNGFSRDLKAWPMIFLESAIWLFPFAYLGILILQKSNQVMKCALVVRSCLIWCLICFIIIGAYKMFYFPNDWTLKDRFPEFFFGWILPCLLIWGSCTWLSVRYFRKSNIR